MQFEQVWLVYITIIINRLLDDVDDKIVDEGAKVVKSVTTRLDEAELNREKRIGIMACGMSISGKSTILNALLKEKQFEVGAHESSKTVVEGHKAKEQFKLDLYYAPEPSFEDADNEPYETMITKYSDKVDILVYCISASTPSLDSAQHIAVVKMLKSALKKSIWKHCVVVLTHSNSIFDRVKASTSSKKNKEYEEELKVWKEKIDQGFDNAGIIISDNEIPVVTAAANNIKDLVEILYEISPPEGKPVVLYFLSNQTILKKVGERLKGRFPIIAAAVGAGGAAGVAGAGIGATIGALAIGIPTFGVAAGVGLLLGGLIGGGVGVGIGAATGTAIEAARSRESRRVGANN